MLRPLIAFLILWGIFYFGLYYTSSKNKTRLFKQALKAAVPALVAVLIVFVIVLLF